MLRVLIADDQDLFRGGFAMILNAQPDIVVMGEAGGFLLKDVRRDELVEAVRLVAAGEALLAPTATRQLIEHLIGSGHPVHPAWRPASAS